MNRSRVRTLVLAALVVFLALNAALYRMGPRQALHYWAYRAHLTSAPISYAFESTYGATHQPTTWAACAQIRYRVDLAGAPAGFDAELTHDLATLSRLTGYRFVDTGPTVYVPGSTLAAPVVIAWVRPSQMLGQSGVYGVTRPVVTNDLRHYVGALVLFSRDARAPFVTDPVFARALVLHELAHVLGLADVADPSELMNFQLGPDATVDHFGPGDLAGLARLTTPACPGA